MFIRVLTVIVLLAAAFPALGQEEANKPNTNWPGYGKAITSSTTTNSSAAKASPR